MNFKIIYFKQKHTKCLAANMKNSSEMDDIHEFCYDRQIKLIFNDIKQFIMTNLNLKQISHIKVDAI